MVSLFFSLLYYLLCLWPNFTPLLSIYFFFLFRWSDHSKWNQEFSCFPQKWLLCTKVTSQVDFAWTIDFHLNAMQIKYPFHWPFSFTFLTDFVDSVCSKQLQTESLSTTFYFYFYLRLRFSLPNVNLTWSGLFTST